MTTKATTGKFTNDVAEVRIGSRVVGTLAREYDTEHGSAGALTAYTFEAAVGTHDDSDLWGVPAATAWCWKGYRVQSAASARREILASIAAVVAS